MPGTESDLLDGKSGKPLNKMENEGRGSVQCWADIPNQSRVFISARLYYTRIWEALLSCQCLVTVITQQSIRTLSLRSLKNDLYTLVDMQRYFPEWGIIHIPWPHCYRGSLWLTYFEGCFTLLQASWVLSASQESAHLKETSGPTSNDVNRTSLRSFALCPCSNCSNFLLGSIQPGSSLQHQQSALQASISSKTIPDKCGTVFSQQTTSTVHRDVLYKEFQVLNARMQ